MVGATVAALLGATKITSRLRVAVLDVKPQPMQYNLTSVPDLRVSTLTPASIEVLRRTGAWEQVAPPNSAPFSHMQVWDSAAPGHIRWSAEDVGASMMGVVAENALLQASLLAAARASGTHTEFIWPAVVKALRLPQPYSAPAAPRPASTAQAQEAGHAERPAGDTSTSPSPSSSGRSHGLAEVELADGRVLACRLVVAADGAASRTRQLAGLRTWGWPYGQRGVVATVDTDGPNTTAWQRFLPTGPLALLPVRDGYSSIVWSTTPDLAAALEQMEPAEFAAATNKVLDDPPSGGMPFSLPSSLMPAAGSSGEFQAPPRVLAWHGSRPKSFPLQTRQAGRYVLPRLALVGDAAHAIHPMAGQGVNLGFGDAQQLAQALAYAKEAGCDVGDARLLADHYEGPRKQANLAMVAAMEGLKKAFAVQSGPLAALRGVGLGLINTVSPVKNNIMKYAMGM